MKLPKGRTVLSQDPRPITSVVWVRSSEGECYRVGHNDITRIEAYDESGHMANIPWIAVFKGDDIVLRTAAEHVDISYV